MGGAEMRREALAVAALNGERRSHGRGNSSKLAPLAHNRN
jgi:hypothetical protein